MGAPDRADDGGGDAPEQQGRGPGSTGGGGPGSLGGSAPGSEVDYQWLAEQLAQLGVTLRERGDGDGDDDDDNDDDEDDDGEWRDPSGGLLAAVFAACEADDAAALQPLLAEVAGSEWGIDAHGPDGDTPLHIAALHGSAAAVDALLAAGARAGAVNPEDGTTPLHDAAAGGYVGILQALVAAAQRQLGGGGGGNEEEAGASGGGSGAAVALAELANARDADGETALHHAARGGHAGATALLLALGADPAAASADGRTPLDEAGGGDDGADEVAGLLRAAIAARGGAAAVDES